MPPFSAGFIHYNEFLAATIQQRQLDEAQLRPAFDRLDRSHTGFINLDDVTLTTGAKADAKESAAILAHFDMNGDGRISFEEFVNGMRRMGGSTREKGGLLSAFPLATDGPFPNGRNENSNAQHRHSGEEEGVGGNAAGKKHETASLSVAGADERGEGNATHVATGSEEAGDQGALHRPSESAPLQPQAPADDVGRGNDAVEVPDNDAPHAALVQDVSKVSRGDGGGAAGAAGSRQASEDGRGDRTVAAGGTSDRAVSAQVVGGGSGKQSVVGNENGVAMSGLEEGRPRLQGQGCGCVLS